MERVVDRGRERSLEKEDTAQRVTLKRDTRGFEMEKERQWQRESVKQKRTYEG